MCVCVCVCVCACVCAGVCPYLFQVGQASLEGPHASTPVCQRSESVAAHTDAA